MKKVRMAGVEPARAYISFSIRNLNLMPNGLFRRLCLPISSHSQLSRLSMTGHQINDKRTAGITARCRKSF